MAAIDDSGLEPFRRHRLERAIAAEPGLDRELELISGALPEASRRRFWAALARASAGRARASSAVLEALAETARFPG